MKKEIYPLMIGAAVLLCIYLVTDPVSKDLKAMTGPTWTKVEAVCPSPKPHKRHRAPKSSPSPSPASSESPAPKPSASPGPIMVFSTKPTRAHLEEIQMQYAVDSLKVTEVPMAQPSESAPDTSAEPDHGYPVERIK